MAKNLQTKDDALEALDFIVNVLKEHERDLDKLINDLTTVTEQFSDTGALNDKVEKVEGKINNLQKEVTNLISVLSNAQKEVVPTWILDQVPQAQSAPSKITTVGQGGPSVILSCNQWEDFQTLAFHAQTISFSYKEDEKVFHVDALKGNQIITYIGALPKFSALLKASLSKQLEVSELNILEGALAFS
ncbi:MAG: hypothetical protein ACXV2C_02670 [Candidatus Bathyarchaeia archaeon]